MRLFCQAKVEQLCLSAIGDENIGRLDVAMNDFFGMSRIECIGNLRPQIEHLIDFHRLSVDRVLERLSLHHLHRDERTPFVLADFVDGADVGMVEGGGGLCFALESFQRLSGCNQFLRKELQGDMAFEAQILRLIHHAHSAAAKLFQDPVMRNGFANHN